MSSYQQIFNYLLNHYKIDFSYYKSTTVERRIARRVATQNLKTLEEYITLLANDQTELRDLCRDLLIGVTSFFRDKEAFSHLARSILPNLIHKAKEDECELRIWVAACSTGEEAYSIAMLVKETCDQLSLSISAKIFATDVSEDFLKIASRGIYKEKKLKHVSAERRKRFFTKKEGEFKVSPDIRNMVVFAAHNILTDPPFTRMDLVCCRNFLIYVQPLIQEKVTDLLRFATKIDGYLFLGPSESLGELEKGMLVIDPTWKIFQKMVEMRSAKLRSFPVIPSGSYGKNNSNMTHVDTVVGGKTLGLQQYAYDQLLSIYIKDGVLIDANREILHIFGKGADYLKYKKGNFDKSLVLNVYEGLKAPLNSCVYQAELEKVTIVCEKVEVGDEASNTLDLEVTPLINSVGQVTHFIVIFHETNTLDQVRKTKTVTIDKSSSQVIQDLERELQQTRHSLQATIEKVETTNEELQSTNEELLASNEELRSTNEELHSVNKELYLVNAEHQNKITELTEVNTDMDNLLRCTEIGTIFVDSAMKLHRFTPAVVDIFNFISADVGRSMRHFRHNLDCENLTEQVEEVMCTGEVLSQETLANNGKLYLMRVMPYLTQNGNCDGAILTFVDVTELNQARQVLEKNNFDLEKEVEKRTSDLIASEKKFSNLYDNAPDMYASVDPESGLINYCNKTLVNSLGYDSKEELIGRPAYKLYEEESWSFVRKMFKIFQEKGRVEHTGLKLARKDRTKIPVSLHAAYNRDESGELQYSISSWRDISVEIAYKKEKEAHIKSQLVFKEQEDLYRTILNSVTDGWWDWNIETKETYLSPSLKNLLGYEDDEVPNTNEGWQRLIYKKDLHKAMEVLDEHIKEGKPYYLPARYHHKNGSTCWVLCRGQALKNKEGKYYRVVGAHTDITELKMAQKELDITAHSDSLTELPNRAAFTTVLKRMVLHSEQSKSKFCVLYIDVDNFKKINDSMGHTFGDRFLVEVSKRLSSACREGDYLARVGGDEFVVVSGLFEERDVAHVIAGRILRNLVSPIIIDKKEVYSTLSIGIAAYPAGGATAELLLKNADAAMYKAKNNGKNKYAYYTDELAISMQRRVDIEDCLRKAVDNNELTVNYQPIINLKTNLLEGFESLIRWKSKELGEVFPSEFIPIAEDAGLVSQLTDWLIDTAFAQYGVWKKKYKLNKRCKLTVNLSVLYLSNKRVVDMVMAVCKRNNMSPKNCVLEITETALMSNVSQVENTIKQLREHDFGIAIDDFGTGYSSLVTLKNLPITHLKIDRSFIQGVEGLDDKAIVKTVLKLGELMGLNVIAEGIENQAQLDYLKKKNCAYAQGFFLQKPMTVSEVGAYLRNMEIDKRELEEVS